MFDVSEATIFVTLAGSQAHGTAYEGSDIDSRGVCIAPFEQRVSLPSLRTERSAAHRAAFARGRHLRARVRRDDAAELDAIRNGAFSYDALMAMTNELTARISAARVACSLSEDVPNDWVDSLCREVLLST